MNVLLLNAGSSSLKASLVDSRDGRVVAASQSDWAGPATRYRHIGSNGSEESVEVPWRGYTPAVQKFVGDLRQSEPCALQEIAAAGHRVVHGGRFSTSVRITPETRSQISALSELAPLHNPPSLETLAATESELPETPHVAVFDTAFHATMPPEAWTYPIPERWTREWGIRRFGFHGLSHAYCARRAAEIVARDVEELRIVICHLGHGCSAAAVQAGRCVDTTMGFTPLEGLMMATRSGSLDPSIVLHVQKSHGLTAEQVETALNRESGLLGVSGLSGDMRQIQAAVKAGDERARLALAVFVHRVRQSIGALAVTLGGVDVLVFTAGIGENDCEIRESICDGLECLGLELDPHANALRQRDSDVARKSSRGRILVVTSREDISMLREVKRVLGIEECRASHPSTLQVEAR